mgnify:CR=1 FL=1
MRLGETYSSWAAISRISRDPASAVIRSSPNTDAAAREKAWGEIDKKVMEGAYILPGVYAKSLLIRPKKLSNVFVSEAYSMYDYTALGVA